jgi:two-component system phosphate regulon sensor histidine kinase PhoR
MQEERSPRLASTVRERLVQSRWLLAAALALVFGLVVTGGHSWGFALLASALLVAVAALAPRRMGGEKRGDVSRAAQRLPVDRLSFSDLAAALPDPLIIFDRKGTAVHVNDAAQAAFGTMAAGTSLELRFRTAEMHDLLQRTTRLESGGIAIDYAERVPLERWYRVTAAPLGRDSGLFVLLFKDQSEARRIDRMRADFIANASHELRTPLASVAGFIETLRGPAKNDPEARERFLEIMEGQTARMARLIDDLLSLSRLEMKSHLHPGETADVAQVMKEVVDALKPLAAELGVTVELKIPPGEWRIAGDHDELFQVFQNLLENACKYGQSGKRVILALERSAAGAEPAILASVRDFGPGIPEEHIPRITERFYRVDTDDSRARKGTGLGLAIVKHILTRHNARLAISSEPGRGAVFTVHFPAPARPERQPMKSASGSQP